MWRTAQINADIISREPHSIVGAYHKFIIICSSSGTDYTIHIFSTQRGDGGRERANGCQNKGLWLLGVHNTHVIVRLTINLFHPAHAVVCYAQCTVHAVHNGSIKHELYLAGVHILWRERTSDVV